MRKNKRADLSLLEEIPFKTFGILQKLIVPFM